MNSQSISQVVVPMQQTPSRIGGKVKGLTMIKQLTISEFAHNVVVDYAEFKPYLKQYDLTVDDLPDFVQHEFAAQIMADNSDYANEATSVDNPYFEKAMLPALLKYLKNTSDKDLEIEFNNAWRDGVTHYMLRKMESLINNALYDYNAK